MAACVRHLVYYRRHCRSRGVIPCFTRSHHFIGLPRGGGRTRIHKRTTTGSQSIGIRQARHRFPVLVHGACTPLYPWQHPPLLQNISRGGAPREESTAVAMTLLRRHAVLPAIELIMSKAKLVYYKLRWLKLCSRIATAGHYHRWSLRISVEIDRNIHIYTSCQNNPLFLTHNFVKL